jgi:hypothetical protein
LLEIVLQRVAEHTRRYIGGSSRAEGNDDADGSRRIFLCATATDGKSLRGEQDSRR